MPSSSATSCTEASEYPRRANTRAAASSTSSSRRLRPRARPPAELLFRGPRAEDFARAGAVLAIAWILTRGPDEVHTTIQSNDRSKTPRPHSSDLRDYRVTGVQTCALPI